MIKKKEINLDLDEQLNKDKQERVSDSDFRSTVNSKKFDMSKFTEIRQKEIDNQNAGKIIILIIIVVFIGVFATLFIRNSTISNNSTTNNGTPTITPTPTANKSENIFVYNTTPTISELNIQTEVGNFINSITVSGGTIQSEDELILNKIEIYPVDNFYRIRFSSQPENKEVAYKVEYDELKKQVTMQPIGIKNIDENLKKDTILTHPLISEIRFDLINNKFIFVLKNTILHRSFVGRTGLYLDLITTGISSNSNNNNTVTTTPTPNITTTITPTLTPTQQTQQSNVVRPTPPKYENTFSTNQQFISSKVTTNSILHNTFYVEDHGPYFEFAFASRGNVGENFIPNVTAYWDKANNQDVLIVEVENLSRTFMYDSQTPEYKDQITSATIQNNLGINMSGANFNSIKLISYQNGKAKYQINVNKKSEFSIVSKVVNINGGGNSQAISINIKD